MNDHRLQMLHSSRECHHRTPPELYAKLNATFRFEIDLAATAENALVEVEGGNISYMGPDHPDARYRDALAVPWHQTARIGFLNPSYSLTMYSDGLKAGIPRENLQWLLIGSWAQKAYWESLRGFTTVGVFPYAAQTEWFRQYVMGHDLAVQKANRDPSAEWSGHAALDCWRIPHRVSFLTADGKEQSNSNVNTCIVIWGPNPGFIGPWTPSMRYWSYR